MFHPFCNKAIVHVDDSSEGRLTERSCLDEPSEGQLGLSTSVRASDKSKYMQQIKVNSTGLNSQPSVKVAKYLLVIMLS